MTSSHSIATTTAMLQAELPQLEEHQQALQKELRQVTERLESVRGALTALNALASTTLPQPRTEAPVPTDTTPHEARTAPANEPTPEPAPADEALRSGKTAVPAQQKTASSRRSPRKAAAAPRRTAVPKVAVADEPTAKRRRTKATATSNALKATTAQETTPAEPSATDAGGLTDQVVAVLADRPHTAMRARDVAHVLGRDDTTGSINTVRSTLDRLVATSRAHRAGRGLYQAPVN